MAKRRKLLTAAFVVVSVFILLYSPSRNALTQLIYTLAPSGWGLSDNVTNSWNSLIVGFQDKNILAEQNKALLAENEQMQVQVLDRNLLAERVSKLEEALGRVSVDNRVSANVIVNYGQSPYDTLILDEGEDAGVAKGDMVVYAGAGVIGEIVETTSTSSKVNFYSSSGNEQEVVIGPHHIPAVALGRGMGNFETKVPQDSMVEVGDTIVSAKGNLILGAVSVIEGKPAEPFKHILFRSPFNLAEVRSVEIILGKK